MAKKEVRKKMTVKKETPAYDSERETRVLLEDIRGEIRTVAQQHGSIMKKLEQHDAKFEGMDQRFDRLEMAVMQNSREIKELKVGVKELKTGQQELNAGQQELKAGQQRLEAGYQELKEGQERIEKKLDSGLDNHEKRIMHLEAKTGV